MWAKISCLVEITGWPRLPAGQASMKPQTEVHVLLKPCATGRRRNVLAIDTRMGKDGLLVPAPQEACLPLERLDRNDAKVLLIWILAGILGACVAYTYFFRAFPEASTVEFKVPRADALALAKQLFAGSRKARSSAGTIQALFSMSTIRQKRTSSGR